MDNAEVLSQEAPGRGETVPEAPQGDLPDSGSRGSKAPEGSEFGPQLNTARGTPSGSGLRQAASFQKGQDACAGDLCPSRGIGQSAGSALQRFH